uniref:Uncharacterized protein n=1 Tax=Callorhinchus milii TaxID=7868 RepID=A0A4W3GV54_CALMI
LSPPILLAALSLGPPCPTPDNVKAEGKCAFIYKSPPCNEQIRKLNNKTKLLTLNAKWDDSISSVIVATDCRLFVYSKPCFGGSYIVLKGSRNLNNVLRYMPSYQAGNWSNVISSLCCWCD